MNKNTATWVLVLIFFSAPAWSLFGPSCKQADNAPKPDWVKTGFSYKQAGFKYGFARAEYQKKEPYQKQLSRAKSDARANLASSLQVNVESSVDMQATVNATDGQLAVNQTMIQSTKTRSNLELPNLTIKAKWQDKESCDLFVLVEMAAATANLVSKKAVAKSLYEKAKDKRYAMSMRMGFIDNAIELAKRWTFADLPNSQSSADMINEYNVVKQNLVRLLASRHNIILFVGGDETGELSKRISKMVAAQVKGSFNGGACSSSTMCLVKGQDTAASYATIVKAQMNTIKERGFYVGIFYLNLSIWDLSNNRQIYSTDDDVTIKSTKVMGRQEHKVNLNAGFNKWLRANPAVLNYLSKYYGQ